MPWSRFHWRVIVGLGTLGPRGARGDDRRQPRARLTEQAAGSDLGAARPHRRGVLLETRALAIAFYAIGTGAGS